jgi:hypothetical protein
MTKKWQTHETKTNLRVKQCIFLEALSFFVVYCNFLIIFDILQQFVIFDGFTSKIVITLPFFCHVHSAEVQGWLLLGRDKQWVLKLHLGRSAIVMDSFNEIIPTPVQHTYIRECKHRQHRRHRPYRPQRKHTSHTLHLNTVHQVCEWLNLIIYIYHGKPSASYIIHAVQHRQYIDDILYTRYNTYV